LDTSCVVHKFCAIAKKVYPAYNIRLEADQTSLPRTCTGSIINDGPYHSQNNLCCLLSSCSWTAPRKNSCLVPGVHRDLPVEVLSDRLVPWQGR